MSKLRIHELAKELGLENKIVLDLCAKLGIQGKSSHSNSLSDDEADKIRRSVIRQAVTDTSEKVRDVAMGDASGTETRIGNVIRRRKKSDEEVAAEQAKKTEKTIDLSDAPQRSFDIDNGIPDYQVEKSQREAALANADALFRSSEIEEDEESAEEAAPAELLEPEQESEIAEPTAEAEEPAEEAASVGAEEEAPSTTSIDQIRRRLDVRAPKVLGKIELPTRPAPVRPERKAAPAASTATDQGPPPADGSSRPGKRKKGETEEVGPDGEPRKHRPKKQILGKAELVDYGSQRDGWKSRKDPKKRQKTRDVRGADAQTIRPAKLVVKITGEISVGELAHQMGVKVGELVMKLMSLGVKATINHLLDFDTATIAASEFGFTTVNTGFDETEFFANLNAEDKEEDLQSRPPVVTVMGHVDHGKTSLLDAIRKTSVTSGEAGGITQHIGAYQVKVPSGGVVTFLDTPGHAAFTAMRSRGAKVTDIVVLVVAADDGVMPQTVEAINHAKAAEVPIIVAMNKVDKESANPDRVKTQLAEHGLIPEDWGGETIMIPVSAHTKQGLDLLLENLGVQAEVMELKANPKRPATGVVIESALDRGRGPVITVLIQNGTLKKGDVILAGPSYGRVRALMTDDGRTIDSAGPGMPVEVLGASSNPLAGEEFYVLDNEAKAREISEMRAHQQRQHELAQRGFVSTGKPLSLEGFADLVKRGESRDLPVIIKGDVQGSVEAVQASLMQLSNPQVGIKIIHAGVGAVTETDIQLANAAGAVILGFNVRAETRARQLAETLGVDIEFYRIIYELVESVKAALTGMLAPIRKEKTLGRVEVRQTFKVPRLGTVAGSYVVDGVVERGAFLRLLRDNRVIFEGKMATLRRFKDDVKEVATGYECGIGIEGYSDIKEGDIIEVYKIEEVKPTLNLTGTPNSNYGAGAQQSA